MASASFYNVMIAITIDYCGIWRAYVVHDSYSEEGACGSLYMLYIYLLLLRIVHDYGMCSSRFRM